jgi:ribosomal protein S18 acetylase RimI-like enzyme
MEITYRILSASDYPILREMFYLSIFVPEGQPAYPESIIDLPGLSIYIEGFGRERDFGFVCEHDGKPVGAIWGRVFKSDKKGFGYIDEKTPELGMAVLPEYRNKGIGTDLLTRFLKEAKQRGCRSVSLSVDKRNPAKRLYERAGFTVFRENEVDFIMITVIS